MRHALWIVVTLATFCSAQVEPPEAEENHLHQVLAEAGGSPLEFIRAVENHLAKFPNSPRRPDLERALVKAAIDSKDDRRVLLHGERVLARDSDDTALLEKVTRILLSNDDKDRAERALKYARRYEELVKSLENEKPLSPRAQVRWREEIDEGMGSALVFQARATGNLDRFEEAISLARRSYESYPTAESAREIGLWLARMGKQAEAIPHFADAFTISDPRNTDADRAKDRKRMGQLYRKLQGSETGLGDLILEAYDRTSALLEQRFLRRRELDPNSVIDNPMDFTLSGLNGEPLELSTLRGKVLIFDFWATWCWPCRVQHPLYADVKQRFKDRSDVLFLSINTDRERALVEPFLDENQWSKTVYFEDGLSKALRIYSIPTTIIANRRGEVVGRLVGFIPGRFVDMLTERIQEALEQ